MNTFTAESQCREDPDPERQGPAPTSAGGQGQRRQPETRPGALFSADALQGRRWPDLKSHLPRPCPATPGKSLHFLGLRRRVGPWQGRRRATVDHVVQDRPRAVDLCSRAGPSGLVRSFSAAEFCNSGAPLRLSPQDASPVWLPRSQDTGQSPEGLPLVPPLPLPLIGRKTRRARPGGSSQACIPPPQLPSSRAALAPHGAL